MDFFLYVKKYKNVGGVFSYTYICAYIHTYKCLHTYMYIIETQIHIYHSKYSIGRDCPFIFELEKRHGISLS